MKKQLLIFTLFLPLLANAQSVTFSDDAVQRGYYTRPYLRYEAENGKCTTNGIFLTPTHTQTELQSEASNQSAVNLVAQNSFVQWTNDEEADGLTIRFSLPDSVKTDTIVYFSNVLGRNDSVIVTHGAGIKGNIALYVNNNFVQNITLDSYWAWQYFWNNNPNIPDNVPSTAKFARMRFDEMHIKLANKIPAGATFKLVKIDNNATPYTIDFVELENVPAKVLFSDISDENKIAYNPNEDGNIYNFIISNRGKTIYIPEGKFDVGFALDIAVANTKIIGAGMWHTELFFNASSYVSSIYNQRGVKFNAANLTLEGLTLNTINNKRYYNNNTANQVGKGIFAGIAALNCVVKNVRSEHFECGAWIDGANNLLVQNCRFTNNYADGINLSYGTKNSVVEHCLFRNNGDDDMATWSRSNRECANNTFCYCTAENNWRASSLGFFGGKQNIAHNIVIIDGMEAGFRVTCDFDGAPFSNIGYNELYNISVYNGGCVQGTRGTSGDLWGNQQGAIHLYASSKYDLKNFIIHDIDLYNSKSNAVFIGSSNKNFNEVYLRNINILTAQNNGVYFNNAKGEIKYCNFSFENVANNMSSIPSSFNFTENCALNSFDLLTPANNANLTTQQATFTWQPSFDAAGLTENYQLFIDDIQVATPNIPTATVEVGNGSHTWYVKANGVQSASVFNFSVTTAGINDIQAEKIIIYPNPVNYELRIMNYELKGNENVQIFDIAGKIIYNSSFIINNSINVSNLQQGIYFFKIDNNIVKFIKN